MCKDHDQHGMREEGAEGRRWRSAPIRSHSVGVGHAGQQTSGSLACKLGSFIPTRFSLGYVKSIDNRRQPPGMTDSIVLSEDAFGHSGFGGSIGFVDPRAGFAFGYAMNRMGQGTGINERGRASSTRCTRR